MSEPNIQMIDAGPDKWQPGEILAWAAARFAPRVALATAFGPEGLVLIDLIARKGLKIGIFTLDTGLLFKETEALRASVEERYRVAVRVVQPIQSVEEQARTHGERLWERDGKGCCALRKLEPLRRELQELDAWVTAIRRDQTPERAQASVVETDKTFGIVKVNPLLEWREQDVWDYIRTHDLPANPLYQRGYRSIGCMPCTTPVAPGEDQRAGRFRGQARSECGLHARPVTTDLRELKWNVRLNTWGEGRSVGTC